MLELIIAIFLGLIIGWFLAKVFKVDEIKGLSRNIEDRDEVVEQLKNSCSEKKHQLERLVDESIVCRHQLLQKSNFLRKKSDELFRVQEKLIKERDRLSKNGNSDSNIPNLKKLLEEKEKLIVSFEREVANLKESDSNYMKISKDQFREIEKRLKEYKSKADLLENKSSQLTVKQEKRNPDLLGNIKQMLLNFGDDNRVVTKA